MNIREMVTSPHTMKSDRFCKLSCKSCWQFDDWTQMTSFSQIFRLYRVSERPNTGQKGHNQAWKAKTRPKGTKGDKLAIFSHLSLFCFFSHTHAWVSRVVGHAIALNIGIIIIFFKCNHKLQCLIKTFRWWTSNSSFKFQICYSLYHFTIIVINDQVPKTNQ